VAVRVADAVRRHDVDGEREARRDLAEAKIADYISRVVAAAPTLTEEQCARITALLRPVPTEDAS
jgi:hypothetical protein